MSKYSETDSDEDFFCSDLIAGQIEREDGEENDQLARRPERSHDQRLPHRHLSDFADLLSAKLPHSAQYSEQHR